MKTGWLLCLVTGWCLLLALPAMTAPDPSGWDPDFDSQHSDHMPGTGAVPAPSSRPPANPGAQTTFQLQATKEHAIRDPNLGTGMQGTNQPVRPPWIPDTAYSNAKLTFVSCTTSRYGLLPSPLHGSGAATVAPDIVQFWTGYKPLPCVVRYKPDEHASPGNFVFRSTHQGGPIGWCVYAGTNQLGFPVYQYWFAQPSGK